MKRSFSTRITGRQWWKPFLFLIATLFASSVAFCLSWMRFVAKPTPVVALLNVLMSVGLFLPVLFVSGLLFFFLYRRTVMGLSVGGEKFSVTCSFGEFAGVYVKGFVLICFTAGLYAPRFIKQIHSYAMHATELNGHRFAFKGKTRNLFRSFLAFFYIPSVIYLALVAALPFFLEYPQGTASARSLTFLAQLGITILFLSSQGLFFSRLLTWLIDLKIGSRRVWIDTDPREAARFFIIQFALSACTFGLYAPMAIMLIWRFLARHAKIGESNGKIHFTGNIAQGFFLILGNTLLGVCTFGIWVPWGCAAILRYLIHETFATIEQR